MRKTPVLMGILLEPIAAIGNPPTDPKERDRGSNRPPEWQDQIGNQAQQAEHGPKDFLLHVIILKLKCGRGVVPAPEEQHPGMTPSLSCFSLPILSRHLGSARGCDGRTRSV